MNKAEDLFPMSVARYFDDLARGWTRIVTRRSQGTKVGWNEEQKVQRAVSIEKDRIKGVPLDMAGDAPGEAPLYWHAFAQDGLLYVEYWVFYPMDRARVKVLGMKITAGGHRGDWEGMQVALDAKGAVVKAFFDAHGEKRECSPAEMRWEGEHPVVFVSQGKHAAYPEPGLWKDVHRKAPLEQFDEFFLGQGYAWRSWEGQLVDLEGDDAKELAPESMKKLDRTGLKTWVDFAGGWGPDASLLGIGGSPVGPKQHSFWGKGGFRAVKWSDVRKSPGLEIKDTAALDPPPLPARR